MNPWLFAFLINLILFFILIDWKSIYINVYGGFISALFKLIEVLIAYNSDLWKPHGVGLNMPDSIIFSDSTNVFFVGISFLMGIIFLQYMPERLGLQFIYSIVWELFFMAFNYILQEFGMFTYIHFRFFMVNHVMLFFLSLAWFKTFWLQRKNIMSFRR